MLFDKPFHKYTDMAIYVDENIDKEDCDLCKVYKCIFHIFMMLSYKSKMFSNYYEYEDFSVFASNYVYGRITNKKLKKIKSILNYCKSVKYNLRSNYLRDVKIDNYKASKCVQFNPPLYILDDSIDGLIKVEYNEYLSSIPNTISNYLSRIPYRYNSVEYNNIYLSILITFLKIINPNNNIKKQLINCIASGDMNRYNRIIEDETYRNVTLYNLDKSMYNYILTLVREIKHIISEDLSYILNQNITTTSNVQSLVFSSLGDVNDYDQEVT